MRSRRGGASEPIVDRRPETPGRNRGDRDDAGLSIKGAKMGEQIGRRLGQVAARRKVEPQSGAALRESAGEVERRFSGRNIDRFKAERGVRRVMRGEHAGRDRPPALHAEAFGEG